MSPEERQKLCERLRSTWSTVEEQIKAADEIERLAALVQPDVEPQEIIEARKRIRECTSWHDCQQCSNDEKAISEYEATIAQSDAEPVAWQTKTPDDIFWRTSPRKRKPGVDPNFFEIRPLYTAPPRPDASAELIEAAEWHQQQADNLRQQREAATFPAYYGQDIAMHTECARVMRELAIARAADRSGK